MTSTTAATEAEREVLVAVERWLDGVRRGDAGALDGLLTPDFTFTHSTGLTEAKDTWLDEFRSGRRRFEFYTLHDLVVRAYPGTSVLSGRSHMKANQTERQLQFLSVWVPLDGQWRLCAWQATRLADPPTAA